MNERVFCQRNAVSLSKELCFILKEKQKFEGFWEMNEENSNFINKNLKKVSDFMPIIYYKAGNEGESLWMTCLILFFLEFFQKEKIKSWNFMFKKGEQWMDLKGFNYQSLKETAKQFYFGFCSKNPNIIPLIKNCKCGQPLNFLKNIPGYDGQYFGCDLCSALNLIEGGVFHCEDCHFDLCEECNNEQIICCGLCKGALKCMNDIPLQAEYKGVYFCDVCCQQGEINKGVYHCSACGKFDLCLNCKANR